jgi:hypothetical protein
MQVCGIATSVAIGFVPLFQDFQKFKIPVMIWLFSAAIADVIITTVLVDYLVSRHIYYEISLSLPKTSEETSNRLSENR